MAVKYSKFITVTGAISHEPITILVECIKTKKFLCVSIESLEGKYSSREKFDEDFKDLRNGKIRSFLPMNLPDTQRLVDVLTEAAYNYI